jgi:hypothetical protein
VREGTGFLDCVVDGGNSRIHLIFYFTDRWTT